MTHVYAVFNTKNGKVYIGKTRRSISRRWSEHCKASKAGTTHFYCALREYGLKSFVISVLTQCPNEDGDMAEQYWIRYFESDDPAKGYNLTPGGDGLPTGFKHSEESKALIRLHANRFRSQETKEKISEALKGRKRPIEVGQKVSQKLRGRVMPADQRERMIRKLTGKHHTKEHNEKIAASHVGLVHSEETKRKISKSQYRPEKIDSTVVEPHSRSGSHNGNSKVTEDDVREIRRRLHDEGAMVEEIMTDYGLSRNAVTSIKLRKSWQHVP